MDVLPTIENETCFGTGNGAVTFLISGGTAPYTLTWTNGPLAGSSDIFLIPGNTNQYANLPPGSYDIVVTDDAGVSYDLNFAINQVANPLIAQVNNQTNIGCGGTVGSATVTVNGGTPPYTYDWQPSAENTQTAVSLSAGNHTVTVTDDNGCTANASVTISNSGGLSVTPSSTPISCNNANDGTASVSVSNGILPISYQWSNSATTASVSGIGPGTITVVVSDATGCSTQPIPFTFINPSALNLTIAITNLTCFGNNSGAALAQVTGGTLPYTYNWGSGQNTNAITQQPPGNVNVTVTDGGGCSQTASATINQPAQLTASLVSFTNASCFGYSDGQATINATGGTPPYQCNWTNPGSSGLSVTNLPQGSFNATVVDANGCTASQTVVINEPAPLLFTVSSNPTDTACIGQDVNLIATPDPSNPGLTFTWADGDNSSNRVVAPFTTTTYSVTASDGVCQSQSQDVVVTVFEPLELVVNVSADVCADVDFPISAQASGGDGNYTVTWSNGIGPGLGPFNLNTSAPLTLTVTLDDGCGSPSAVQVVDIPVNPNPVAFFTSDTTQGCLPVGITFNDESTISQGNITAWAWDFGNGSTSTQPTGFQVYTTPGEFTVSLIVTSDRGCKDTLTIDSLLSIYPYPVASFDLSSNTVDIINPSIALTNNSVDASAYLWQIGFDSITDVSPTYTFTDTGTYFISLTAISPAGCMDVVTQKVGVLDFFAIYIPNAFTPEDPDLINDVFKPKGVGIREYELKIYDRWGNRVFRTKNIEESWDGTVLYTGAPAEQGNYIYDIYLRDANGKQRFFAGSVKLVR